MSQTVKIQCDVVVVGGGPGGYTAAFRAADLGLSVCLVEQRECLGGVCLNEGCIPSKTLLHGTSLIEEAVKAVEYGVSFEKPKIDIAALRAKKESVISQLTKGLDTLGKARNISRLTGKGFFQDRSTLIVEGSNAKTEVKFTDAIIATGSSPFSLQGLPDDPRIWDSGDALALKTVPEKLLIIGGGVIGMEMAQIYSALGSKITIVEMLDHIIPPADKDLIQPLFLKLKKKYQILTKTRVVEIKVTDTGILACFEGARVPDSGEFDAVLVAVGRRPNITDMGVENIGFEITEQGFISTNTYQQTSVPHFYAVGDVVGEPMLAHKATHQAKVAAENIAGLNVTFNPKTIPSVAYTTPEVAWMGLTEKEAKEKKIDFSKGKFPWGASGRALSVGASTGVTKVLFNKLTGEIIGAGICGAHAGELIHEAVLALEKGATAEDISKMVHAHPTLAETFGFAAEIVTGTITDALPPRKR
ncbi:MAG: dihydrolipoyl dehydrogenase [Thermodesulfobacteriota bacterium]|nr:dihydrolipoyl dehydrogenase [Thermodesulfobacteriota bacterium]